MIHHVVAMRFKDPADAAEARDRLLGLVGRVPEIVALLVHMDSLKRDGSYHLLLVTDHQDEAGLSGYQSHPAHLAEAGWLKEHLDHRAVVDWQD